MKKRKLWNMRGREVRGREGPEKSDEIMGNRERHIESSVS